MTTPSVAYGVPPLEPPVSRQSLTEELERLLNRDNLISGRDGGLSHLLLLSKDASLAVTPECLLTHARLWILDVSPDALLEAAAASPILRVDLERRLIYPQLSTSRASLVCRDIPAGLTIAQVHAFLATQTSNTGTTFELAPLECQLSTDDAENGSTVLTSGMAITVAQAAALAACSPQLHSISALEDGSLVITFNDHAVAKNLAWKLRQVPLGQKPPNMRLKLETPISRETIASQVENARRVLERQVLPPAAQPPAHQPPPPPQQRRRWGQNVQQQHQPHVGEQSAPARMRNPRPRRPPHQQQQLVMTVSPRSAKAVVSQTDFPTLSDAVRMRECGYGGRSFVQRTRNEIKSISQKLPPSELPENMKTFEPDGIVETTQRKPSYWPSDALDARRLGGDEAENTRLQAATAAAPQQHAPPAAAPSISVRRREN